MPLTRYRIRITRLAANQLQEVFDYIEKESPENARRMISRLLSAVDSLELFPRRYKVVKNTDVVGTEVRSMSVRPYLVRYHVDETERVVTVLSVRHGARKPER